MDKLKTREALAESKYILGNIQELSDKNDFRFDMPETLPRRFDIYVAIVKNEK
ncbi:MAG TPA: hypothetical protein VM577_03460 [Anaerovoracaceae bacterium]|nr:hypothetical protein [Anaerovoracaceae bacterium]